jgi:signal transduction histidine kinase
MPTTDQRTVLLVSDDDEFIRRLTDHWQAERVVPTFLAAADEKAFQAHYDLAIVGPFTAAHACTADVGTDACPDERSSPGSGNRNTLHPKLAELAKAANPVIALAPDQESLQSLRREFPRVLALGGHETWPDTLVALATEVLRRIEAAKRAERAEHLNQVLKRNATLGQYVIDMRHSLNNALTSVLGNAELLLPEPGTFSAVAHSQLDTIRHMSLRMHEILQRFSSLEKELSFAEKQTLNENGPRQVAAAAP